MNLSSLNPFARKTSSVAVQPPAAAGAPAPTPTTSKGKRAVSQTAPVGPGLVERLWTSWLNRPRAVPAAPASAAASTSAPAQDHFEAIRNEIEAFDEEKKGALERLMTFLFTVAAYVGPFIVALAVAQEIADTYSGAWQWGNSWSVATHLVAWFGELGLAALTVSIATAVRRAASDGEMLPRLVASIVAFVVFSVASGLAQWYVAMLHVSPGTTAGHVALAFRVAMPVAIDLASMLYLSIMKIKSLKRYLAEMGQKAEAIEQVNKSHLRVEQAQQEAHQAKQQHDQYMQSLAATQQVVIDLQRLITGHIVTTATAALSGRPAGETLVELAPAVDAGSQDGAQPEGVAASNGHRSFRRSR